MFSRLITPLLGRQISVIPKRFNSRVPKDLSLVVTKDEQENTLDFITWNFIPDEPMIKAMGIEDTCDLQRFFKNNIKDAIAFKLVNGDCDTVALALCHVITPKTSSEQRTFADCSVCDPKTKRLIHLWTDIEDSNNLFKRFNVKEIWGISVLATAPSARGRGLSKIVAYEAKMHGKKEGLAITRMDCTSFFSARLASSLRFVTLPPRHALTFRDPKGCPWLPRKPEPPHGHVTVAYDFLV